MTHRRLNRWLMALAVAAFANGAAYAQTSINTVTGENQPVVIEADDGLEWIPDKKRYIARGNATARGGNAELRADTLTAHYDEQQTGQGQQITRVDADGNVRIQSGGTGKKAEDRTTARGDKAVYYVDQSVFVLVGRDLKLVSAQGILTAKKSLEYWDKKQIAVARGNAVVINGDQRLHADILTAYLQPEARPAAGGKAKRNEVVSTANRNRPAPPGADSEQIKRIEAFNNVHVSVPNAIIRGDRGVYVPTKGIAVLEGNVKITCGKNQLNGGRAWVNLKTGIYKLQGGRVKGLIKPDGR